MNVGVYIPDGWGIRLLVPLITLVASTVSGESRIFAVEPGHGLWSATLDAHGNGSASKLSTAIPHSALVAPIQIASYDPAGDQMLIETKDDQGELDIYIAKLCSSSPHFKIQHLFHTTRPKLSNDQYGDCVNCEATAFAIHSSKLYFLVSGEYTNSAGTFTYVMELRMFKDCSRCGRDNISKMHTFEDMIQCSKLVSRVIENSFTFSTAPEYSIHPPKSMKVVKIDRKLNFFFQYGNVSDGIASTHLYRVEGESVQELKRTRMGHLYTQWDMVALGSVDYRDGMLCWTTGHAAHCALLQSVDESISIMEPSKTLTSKMCQGSDTNKAVMLSGVAIADVGDENGVLLGCYAGGEITGGAGLVRFGQEGDKQVHKLTLDGKPAVAGSLTIVENLKNRCDEPTLPQICLSPSTTTTAAPTKRPSNSENDAGYKPVKDDNGVEGGNTNQVVSGNGSESSLTSSCITKLLYVLVLIHFFVNQIS